MYRLILTNSNGVQLEFNQMGGPFTIKEITGLNPPTATINTNTTAIMDGARFNSSKLNMRTINIAFAIEYDAAINRLEVYKVLQTKKIVHLRYTSDTIDVMAEGYVESIDISYFSMKQIVTVAILCPFPYLKDAQTIVNDLSNLISTFHFAFASTEVPELIMGYVETINNVTVRNSGTVDVGMSIELYAAANISNPKVYNYATGEYIGVTYSMEAGDTIKIDTTSGNKSVVLLRNGVESNLFNYLAPGSKWLQLDVGVNEFVYTVDSNNASNLSVTIRHNDLFEGV